MYVGYSSNCPRCSVMAFNSICKKRWGQSVHNFNIGTPTRANVPLSVNPLPILTHSSYKFTDLYIRKYNVAVADGPTKAY